MRKFLFLLLALTCFHLWAGERYPAADPESVSAAIADLIDIGDPVFLEIQAGDLSSDLDFRLRQLLLAKGADLREPRGVDLSDSDALAGSVLASLALRSARLVTVSLELGGTTVESRSFLSFRSERLPLYTFQVKQLLLPDQRLERVDSLSFIGRAEPNNSPAVNQARWLEPVIAATALASIVYLLWTIE